MTSVLALIPALGAVVAIVWITYRQLQWQPLRREQLFRTPIILAGCGAVLIGTSLSRLPLGWHLSLREVSLLALELVVALGVGGAMGRSTQLEVRSGVLCARLRALGVSLWMVLIAGRVAVNVAGPGLHAPLLSLSGVGLMAIAVVKLTQWLVVRQRLLQMDLTPRARETVGARR